jgi:hypothetical protein
MTSRPYSIFFKYAEGGIELEEVESNHKSLINEQVKLVSREKSLI